MAVKKKNLKEEKQGEKAGVCQITRKGLIISCNRSHGVMNPPQRQKAADIQRRAMGCPSRCLENYS